MEKLINLLKSSDGYIGGNGVDDKTIAIAESELGISFSQEYTNYLREIGLCIIEGHEFTGISDEKRTNVVDVTKEQRNFNPHIPTNMYVIEELGMDYKVIWQDNNGQIYVSSYDNKPVPVASSIVEFIENNDAE